MPLPSDDGTASPEPTPTTASRAGIQADVGLPRRGALPAEQLAVLIKILRRHTLTPQSCRAAVWDGFGGLAYEQRWPGAATFQGAARRYYLLTGAIEAMLQSIDPDFWQTPNLWWPEDRSWIVSTDLDDYWTHLACDARCASEILHEGRLQAVRISPEDPAPVGI